MFRESRRQTPLVDLNELEGFLAVVETGSFASASQKLGVSRATLRRRVDSLEAQTGIGLLNRSARGVKLTPPGRILAKRGRELLIGVGALLAAPRQSQRKQLKPIRVVVPPGLPPRMLDLLMDLGGGLHAEFSVEIEVTATPLLVESNRADLAVFHGPPPRTDDWTFQRLFNLPLSIMATGEHLSEYGNPTTPEELMQHRLVTWTQSGYVRSWPLRSGGELDIQPWAVSNDAPSLLELVRAGRVIALLPDANLARIGLNDDLKGLVRVLPGEVGGVVPVFLAIPRHAERHAAVLPLASGLLELMSRVRWA